MGVLDGLPTEIGDQVGDLGRVEFGVETGLLRGVVLVQRHQEQVGAVLQEVLHAQVSLGDAADGRDATRLGLHLLDALEDIRGGGLHVGSPRHDFVQQVLLLKEQQGEGLPGLPEDDLGWRGIQGDGAVCDVLDGQRPSRDRRRGALLIAVTAR